MSRKTQNDNRGFPERVADKQGRMVQAGGLPPSGISGGLSNGRMQKVFQPIFFSKAFMKSTSASMASMPVALYMEARHPPTERCPLSPPIP